MVHLLKFTGPEFISFGDIIVDAKPKIQYKNSSDISHSSLGDPTQYISSHDILKISGEIDIFLKSEITEHAKLMSTFLGYSIERIQGAYAYGVKSYSDKAWIRDPRWEDSYQGFTVPAAGEMHDQKFNLYIEYNVDKLDPDISISRAMAKVYGMVESTTFSYCSVLLYDCRGYNDFASNITTTLFKIKIGFSTETFYT